MSRIVVPSKPSWKITITLDESGQAQILVEDQRMKRNTVLAGPLNLPVTRQMNPLQFATILMDIAGSTLKQMQVVAHGPERQ